jgi:hypothetical protein
MEVSITQFRRNLFHLAEQALNGADVSFMHKGRRLKVVPEGEPADRLSRITPMEIIAPGVDLEDDSWKDEMMREWERGWDRQLGPVPNPSSTRKAPPPKRTRSRSARRRT